MVNPRVSVVVFTARPGGIDVLLTGLARQDFDDFELVLVDALYDRRSTLVSDLCATYKIRVQHVPPRLPTFPYDAIPIACNTAIARAKGELLMFCVDYSYLPPRCLWEHWGVYAFTNRERAGMGAHRYRYPPSLAFPLPDYAPSRDRESGNREVTYLYDEKMSRRYVDDVMAGRYDPWMYSIFEVPITQPSQIDALSEDPYFFQVDPKLHAIIGAKISGNFMHLKNDSIPLSWLLQANGVDEAYTGHIYCDTDLGYRLERFGAIWMMLDPVAWISIVNPRHVFPHILWRAEAQEHRARYEAVRENTEAHKRANPSFNLEEIRKLKSGWY